MRELKAWSLGDGSVRAELSDTGWVYLDSAMANTKLALSPAVWIELVTLLAGHVVDAAREDERAKLERQAR